MKMTDIKNGTGQDGEMEEPGVGNNQPTEAELLRPSEEDTPRGPLQARLLRILLLTLFLLLAITLILVLLDIPVGDPLRVRYFFLVGSIMLLIIPAYVFNESGRYNAASKLTVLVAIVGSWSTLIIDPRILMGDPIPLLYLSIAPMLASLLLGMGETILVAAVQLVGIPLIPIISPLPSTINWASMWVFVFFISAFSFVFSRVLQEDMEYMLEQAQRLSRSEERMRELAVRDPLTGLFNRRHLEDIRRELLACNEDQIIPHSLIIMDVDEFKEINDILGHAAGDHALRSVAAVLQDHIRKGDWAFRYGGDEFLVVMPRTPMEAACERARLILREAKNIGFPEQMDGERDFFLTLGVASYPEHGSACEDVLRSADHALLRGKEMGGNQVVMAGEEDSWEDGTELS